MIVGICNAAKVEKSPIIFLFHKGLIPIEQWAGLKNIIDYQSEICGIPCFVQLDHGNEISEFEEAIKLDFAAIQVDVGKYDLPNNIDFTRKMVNKAKAKNILVEGTLGHIGTTSSILNTDFFNIEDIEEYVISTGIDMLAISFGNAHGEYIETPTLDYKSLGKIQEFTNIPLVLHGGSFIPKKDLVKSIGYGISKANFWTELSYAYSKSLLEEFTINPKPYFLLEIVAVARMEVQHIAQKKIKSLKSFNRLQ